MISNMRRILLCRPAEMDPVGDKELAADDEEQDDARQDVREGLVQLEGLRDLPGAPAQEGEQEAGQDHPDRVEFRQPGDHDRREAVAARKGRRQRVVRAADQQEARDAAIQQGYTEDQLNNYRKRREQEPDSWRCNIEEEFYTKIAIPQAMQQNKESEALFEYITHI